MSSQPGPTLVLTVSCALYAVYTDCVYLASAVHTHACLRLIRSASITAYTSLVFCVSVGCYVTSSLPSNELLLLLVPGGAVTSSPLPLVSRPDGESTATRKNFYTVSQIQMDLRTGNVDCGETGVAVGSLATAE